VLNLTILDDIFEALLRVFIGGHFCDIIDDDKAMETLVLRNHDDATIVIEALRIDKVALVVLVAYLQNGRVKL
jgi:hypothetical protein